MDLADHVSRCIQLAVLLEVSAYPKPGNVHRTQDFSNTRYEHFLASTVAIAPLFRLAAERGRLYSENKVSANDLGIGQLIKCSVKEMLAWQNGGNTLLGTIILLIPMAAAAGASMGSVGGFSAPRLREVLKRIVESTTPEDAVAVYEAINMAKPGGLGSVAELDVSSPESINRILRERITLFEIFKIASSYDAVASEWVSSYRITFEVGYPYILRQLEEHGDINIATVNTFLKILSEVPDTLIARKVGEEEARRVSSIARRVLERGGLSTDEGRRELEKFDRMLRDPRNLLNPGSTADLISATLAVLVLGGYRP